MWRQWYRAAHARPTLDQLRLGLVWAACHVHTRVGQAEWEFREYVRTGKLPVGTLLSTRKKATVKAIHAWLYGPEFDWYAFLELDTAGKLEAVVSNISGLGATKGAFGLTSAGLTDLACLDVHILEYRAPTLARTFARWHRWGHSPAIETERYLRAVLWSYGRLDGSGWDQWTDYETLVPAFRTDGHRVWFEAIGIA